ncbi:glycoside hydrolase family 95 protein [Fomitiporia mediterranea MF3/22]|uniref:glycoside hydrolase family 95 protein n=1 Tax=Fomitiporia mediterranea (strain MF3/22) TaxID=694068 RepID=UPI0004408FC5|nr:glycoside hydrolase family 95 protein [Fomitiporia mediterranea MF3/22]EJD08446.1 glycoside hydrolase family 95 protein [Fomitiporia mediterranea MF3/22]
MGSVCQQQCPVNIPGLGVLQPADGLAKARFAPLGFPSSGNGLWYDTPGNIWARQFLPVGNGFLGAMISGGTTQESTQLNIESLWSGGPFADPGYNGGNKQLDEQSEIGQAMRSIRQKIFKSKHGTIDNVDALMAPIGAYGNYSSAGFLVSTLTNTPSSAISDYARFLDLETGVARTIWTHGNYQFTRETFCSYPAQACAQNTSSTNPSGFSQTYALGAIIGLPPPNVTCADNSTLRSSGLVSNPGMAYEILATVSVSPGGIIECNTVPNVNHTRKASNATLTISNATSMSIMWVGGTNYDAGAGDAAHSFSFRGSDPHEGLSSLLISASEKSYSEFVAEHISDFKSALNPSFSLNLGQNINLKVPTDKLKDVYRVDKGDPYLEWLLFNYGRYLLVSSARGALPANLQGKWARDAGNPWSADYHVNINLQMNYWFAESTNLDVTKSLFDFIEETWVSRGTYTAQVLYNSTQGWVLHNEINIFGHTGMKQGDAEWADYPESNAWMMIHVWDHFDFTNDVAWWKAQGYPLVKGAASFHLNKLIPDERFKDGTLVVAPCNSPEQPPITLACAHAQQVIWQLFNAVEKGAAAAGETDEAFLNEIKSKKGRMDKGIHIGSWGQLQEWKVDMDSPTDTHRHMSHLVGLYPGYAISNYNPDIQGLKYSVADVRAAARTSLIHRGNGTGPDADSGWEKVWRAACWAQFADPDKFYHELTYAVDRNFAANLFSIYNPFDPDPIFQIDANFGYTAAVMNALIQAPDVASTTIPLTITLLPALPSAWSTGSISGARVRGGITVDMAWVDAKPTKAVLTIAEGAPSRPVHVIHAGQEKLSFNTTGAEWTYTITGF